MLSRFSVILAVFALGCGSMEKGEGGSSVPVQSPGSPEVGPLPEPGVADNPTPVGSFTVTSATALPVCDAPREGQLVYLIAEKKFQTCSQGAWRDIDIKGPQGDKGADGAVGAAGATGAAGPKGDKGEAGAAGEDGELPANATWIDPVTNKKWFVGGWTNVLAYAEEACGLGWRLGTSDELTAARNRGILTSMSNLVNASQIWEFYNCALDSTGAAVSMRPSHSCHTTQRAIICVAE